MIGNSRFGGSALTQPSKDAVAISRALLRLGFDVVRRENIDAGALPLGDRVGDVVAVYYSGRTEAIEGDILLRGAQLGQAATAGWRLLDTARALRDAGAAHVMIFVETCQAEGDSLNPIADDAQLDGIYIALSHDPNAGCTVSADSDADADPTTRFTDRLQLALTTPDEDLQSAFEQTSGQGWTVSGLRDPLVLWASDAQPDVQLGDADLSLLERLPQANREQMRAMWSEAGLLDADGSATGNGSQIAQVQAETVVITAAPTARKVTAVSPLQVATATAVTSLTANTGSRILPSTTRPARAASGGTTDGVQIFNSVVRAPAPAAIATAAGLPKPSIIVGEIRPTNASFNPTQTGGSVTGTTIDTSSVETRQGLQATQPDLYLQLIASGNFDPTDLSEEGIARAIQTELQRMKCYTSTIDGDFGRGSRAALARYYEQVGTAAPTTEPTLELYRAIIGGEDVVCPVVRQAATPRNTATGQSTRSTTRSATQRRQSAPKPRAAAPAAKPKPKSGGINPNTLGTGVFR